MGRYDVVVVGASYAGLAAAAQMPGRRVLVLERHDSVVTKHRGCLGLLLPLGEQVEVRGENLHFPSLELFVEGGVRHRFDRMEIRGDRERIEIPFKQPLLLCNEGRLKGALLRRAREIGAEVQVGAAVREVDSDNREARVRTGEDHQARVLVGADGAHSLVARSLNLRREKHGMLFAREVKVASLDLPPQTLLVQTTGPHHLFFAFSQGDAYLASLIQVLGVRDVPEDLEKRLDDHIERLGAGRRLAVRTAVVRMFAPSPISYKGNVVLTGDALAAFGIATIAGAVTMGSLCGRAIHRFLAGSRYALPEYHETWRDATQQGWIDKLRFAGPLLGRCEAKRVDRMLHALRGVHDTTGLFLRLPALLWQFLV